MEDVIKTENRDEVCPLCGRWGTSHRLSDILKFATLDKPGFAPLFNKSLAGIYVCEECYLKLRRAMDYIDRYLSIGGFGDLTLWVIPEIVGYHEKNDTDKILRMLKRIIAEEKAKEGQKKGKKKIKTSEEREKRLWQRFAEVDVSVVFHMLFVKKQNNAVQVKLMIHDIPPSRMARIAGIYKNVVNKWSWLDRSHSSGEINLDVLIADIWKFFVYDLNTSSTRDNSYLVQSALQIIGDLLEKEKLPADKINSAYMSVVGASSKQEFIRFITDRAMLLSEMAYALDKSKGEVQSI